MRLTRARLHALVIILAIVIHLAHQWAYRHWYLEDAAIVFAYARNLVNGEGLVPWPGGERIEGYSDPLWLALIALFQAVGVEGWTSGKLLAAFFGAGALPLSWLVAREALADRNDDAAAAFAPLVLAINAFHVIWSASALENSLFTFLLLLGVYQLLREARGARYPWSALVFLALAWTRPDGVLYAAIGGFWHLVHAVRAGRGLRSSVAWVFTFWVPYLALVALRVWYFAFHFPNTYYAKVGVNHSVLHLYYARGWSQIRQFCEELWTGWFLPVYVLGLLGARGWRHRVAWAVIVGMGLALLIPGPFVLRWKWFWPDIPEPYWWLATRIVVLAILAVGLPFVAMGGRGWRARALCWHMAACAVFFSIYSNGDWTRGLRWMSFFAGPAAVLFAVGVDEVVTLVQRLVPRAPRWSTGGWLVAALLVAMQFPPHVEFSRDYYTAKDDFPGMIRYRANYTQWFADRVFLDEQVRALDMDMGAHLWWSDQWMVDMAGLVDVPMSLHSYRQREFIQEYVYDERRPHFAHVHGHWADESNLKSYPDWDDTYFRLPGYVYGQWLHYGIYARRELLMRPRWEGPEGRRVEFARGVVLEGFDVPSPEVGQGRRMFVEVGFRSAFERAPHDPFDVTVFLARAGGGRVVTWDLPLGYEVYPVDEWEPDEVFRGRFAFPIPKDLPEGEYELGFAVTGGRGFPLPAGEVPAGAVAGGDGAPARYMRGEVRFPGLVTVVTPKASDALARADLEATVERARADDCEGAERSWTLARRHVPRNERWEAKYAEHIEPVLARCWTRRAQADPHHEVAHLERAWRADHRVPMFQAHAEAVADRLYARGMEAMAREDWEAAYRHFSDVLRFAPHRSWARRRAEQARDRRLGLYDDQKWTWSRLGPY